MSRSVSCEDLDCSDQESGRRSWCLKLPLCTFRVNWVSLVCLAILEDKDPRLEKHQNHLIQVTLVSQWTALNWKWWICLPGFSWFPGIPWFQRREGNSSELEKCFASVCIIQHFLGKRVNIEARKRAKSRRNSATGLQWSSGSRFILGPF